MVTILYNIGSNHAKNRLCIEFALRNIGETPVEFFAINGIGSYGQETVNFIDSLIDNKELVYKGLIKTGTINEPIEGSLSEHDLLNKLMTYSKYNHVCILSNSILNKGWLDDCLFYSKSIKQSGIVSIKQPTEKHIYVPFVNSEDSFINVLDRKDTLFNGVCLFDKALYLKIESFEQDWHKTFYGYLQSNNYNNFYVPDQCQIRV